MKQYYIYDLETYPNCFLFIGKFLGSDDVHIYEISSRVNHRTELIQFLNWLQSQGVFMVGYNNLGFDYPIIHDLLMNQFAFSYERASKLANEIIKRQNYGFTSINFTERVIPQIDLMKLNHFDNRAKRTSLKALQFAMRSESVEDLPFELKELTFEEMDQLRSYGGHDVTETERFFVKCMHAVEMRHELVESDALPRYKDVLNFSDVKIGTEFLVKRIGRNKCYRGSQPIQTSRSSVALKNIILPMVNFKTPQFQEVLDWFKDQTIWIGTDNKPKFESMLAGLEFHFGLGGVHASVDSKVFESNDEWVIIDIDVAGMYPAVSNANGFRPEHLGDDFVRAYKQLSADRKQYPKGSAMNKVFKLANNGAFGNSNNVYSPLYDPQFTFSITVNGQLQLTMLIERLSQIPTLKVIQANTDGTTVYLKRSMLDWFHFHKADWERETRLELEEVEYKKMWIRDVNNYVALDTNDKVKLKGAYWYPKSDSDYWGGSGSVWNKDFSSMVVQKCAEKCLLYNVQPNTIIRSFTDPFDFMLRYKTPGGAKVYIGDEVQQRTVRYYISKSGKRMLKVSQPKGKIGQFKRKNKLTDEYFNKVMSEIGENVWDDRIHTGNKSRYGQVETSIQSGRLVKQCNHIKDFDWSDVDYEYYIEEVKKLLIGGNNV